ISALEKEEKITLDPLQRKAVLEAASNAVLLISGGPGTGKTTTINTIIRFFKGEKLEVVLAAPTGRAARRMSEATGCPAMTIHRLLGVRSPEDSDPGEGGFPDAGREYSAGGSAGEKQGGFSYFERGKDNPIKADVVIIDEMSMVDMNLFHALLLAVPAGARLVMVGDVNQLPSVGPGCVLQDLIESGSFHTIMLRHIFRQASESDIVMNAHRILEGTSLPMDNKSRDFFFLERDQVPVIYKHTVQLIRQMLPGYVGCRPEDIQVLTPMRRGNLGVARLNEVLQSVLNPPAAGKREHEDHDTVFREGDKVMQTRNNYGIEWEIRGNFGMPVEQGTGIFNGDFGRIMEIDPGRKVMTVCFDDARMVEYQFSDLEDLDLAYAITVHKSQGSEYPAVILPLLSGPSGLFNRNLLYTAVTRARKCVVMLGSRGAVDRMIANTQRTHRYTGLRERILEMGDGKDGGFS
ncbi:MAG: AAA family ATPase, partial [Oscillospiraceae bacterium]|nr:AAA family ATPase [Oscillospiraceae bacterium]